MINHPILGQSRHKFTFVRLFLTVGSFEGKGATTLPLYDFNLSLLDIVPKSTFLETLTE